MKDRGLPGIVNILSDLALVVLGTFLLSTWVFYNGYVFFYGDSAGYVLRAFTGEVSHHWAMAYSFFIKYASLGTSLIFVSIFQCALLSFLLLVVIKALFPDRKLALKIYLTTIVCLAAFTSLPWMGSLIMADVFTAIGTLALFALFLQRNWNGALVLSALLFCFSISCHKSHKPIFLVIVLFGSLLYILHGYTSDKRSLLPLFKRPGIVIVLYLSALWIMTPLVNSLIIDPEVENTRENESVLGEETAPTELHFVWWTLRYMKIYDKALEKYCPEEQYSILCDSLEMAKYGEDGYRNDMRAGGEFAEQAEALARNTLFDPQFILPMIFRGVQRGFLLAANYRIPIPNEEYVADKSRKKRVFKKIPRDIKRHQNSVVAQSNSIIPVRRYYELVNEIVVLSWFIIVLILAFFIYKVKPGRNTLFKLVFGILAVVSPHFINCILMASFGNMFNQRYAARTSWLLMFLIVIMATVLVTLVKKSRKEKLKLAQSSDLPENNKSRNN